MDTWVIILLNLKGKKNIQGVNLVYIVALIKLAKSIYLILFTKMSVDNKFGLAAPLG